VSRNDFNASHLNSTIQLTPAKDSPLLSSRASVT
jgi:hypothetical protein